MGSVGEMGSVLPGDGKRGQLEKDREAQVEVNFLGNRPLKKIKGTLKNTHPGSKGMKYSY